MGAANRFNLVKVNARRPRLVRALTTEDQTALQQLYQQGRTHFERRRAQLLLLPASGHDLQEADGRALRLFAAKGVAALRDVPRPGRASALGSEARDQLPQVLRQSSREQGYATNNWTGPLLRDYRIKTYRVTLSVDQVQRIQVAREAGMRLIFGQA